MANELSLVLDKPVEELVPQLIAWNNEELLTEVKTRIAEYKGRVYDESSIAEAKADRATLNKFVTALDSERKRIKKVYTAPLDKFTAEVNEVIAAVNEVSSEIDEQVKAYDELRKQEKQKEIKSYFNSVLPVELQAYIPYEKIHKKEWLNATANIKSVKKEIDGIISDITTALATIANLSTEDKDYLKLYYLETLSLTQTLQENENRKARAAQIARLKAEREEAEQRAAEAQKTAQNANFEAESAPQEEEPAPKEYNITFTFTGKVE
ncbi:MAG: DUF1351 domain-containing protein [Clostridia bacterium]|nr:DUF1351 domain-containing protein [Clostridia bacterium]